MKTKHLLKAMALPLIFAACSQEEIVTDSPVLGERKVAGEVALNVSELDSRMAIMGGKYTWETGDKFGACLMDELLGYDTDNDWFNDFKLVDYIQTNYPFTRLENGVWKAEAVMSEGNYFFYFPYNYNGGGLRSAIKLDIPTKLVADVNNPTEMLNDQLFVGYQAIQADEKKTSTSVDITMEPLLAFPKFSLKNIGTTDVTVYKITYADYDGEEKTAAIVPASFASYYEMKPATAEFNNSGFAWMNSTQKRNAVVSIAKEGEDNKVDQIAVAFGENGTTLAANGGEVETYMLMDPVTTTYPKLYIYTNAGLGIVDLTKPNTDPKSSDGTTNITNDRELKTIAYNDGAKVYITFDNTALDQPFAMSVRSTDELENLVYWSRKNTGNEPLVATLVNDEVALTKKVYDMLKANDKLKLQIFTDDNGHSLNIPADAPKDILKYVNYIDAAYGDYNKVQIKVAEGANIKLPKELNKGIVVENYGTIELANSEYFHIENHGTINITGSDVWPYAVKVTGLFNNYGEVVNKTATTVWHTYNWGTITNDGTYTIDQMFENLNGYETSDYVEQIGKFVNNGTFNFIDYDTDNAGRLAYNHAMFENNGTIDCTYAQAFGNEAYPHYNSSYTKYYDVRIINNGVMNGVTNNGLVTMGNVEARIQSNAASTGEINNNALSRYVNKGTNEDITLDITGSNSASEVAYAVEGSKATILYLSGTLTIDPAEGETTVNMNGQLDKFTVVANDNLTINGKGTLKVRSTKGTKRATEFLVVKNTTTVVEQGAYVDMTNATVNAIGKLLIQAGASFKATVGQYANIEDYSKTLVK